MPGVGAAWRYERRWLRADVVAGLVLAAILVPQGMAYAELAGLPPVTGLYTTIGCLVGYAIFGPSPGARARTRLVDLTDDPRRPDATARRGDDPMKAIQLAGMLALLVGIIEIGLGVAKLARVLLTSGAAVGAVSRNEMLVQPLHSAAAGLHHEVCRVLIAAGADVNARQAHAFTPLHAAAQHGDDELVELLLSAGADPTARTDAGATPADTADAAGHVDVARRLRQVAEERSASV